MDVETLARRMYERNARTYGPELAALEELWEDPAVRGFWLDEAGAILGWMAEAAA